MATPSVSLPQKHGRVLPTSTMLRQRGHNRPLAAPIKQKSTESEADLLATMLPMVKSIALRIRKHLPAQVELAELTVNGIVGLVDAAAKFDPNKGAKFDTYARHRVRGAILDGLRSTDPITRDVRRKSKRIETFYRELESKLGRPVQDEELATALGMTLGRWHQELNETQSAGLDSGSRVISAGPTMTLQSTDPEFLVDGRDSPFDLCYRREQHDILGQALSRLRERERKIVTLHDQQGLTMKQIAGQMHVDESRVSQIHSMALERLKANVNVLLQPRSAEAPESHPRSMAASTGHGW